MVFSVVRGIFFSVHSHFCITGKHLKTLVDALFMLGNFLFWYSCIATMWPDITVARQLQICLFSVQVSICNILQQFRIKLYFHVLIAVIFSVALWPNTIAIACMLCYECSATQHLGESLNSFCKDSIAILKTWIWIKICPGRNEKPRLQWFCKKILGYICMCLCPKILKTIPGKIKSTYACSLLFNFTEWRSSKREKNKNHSRTVL